jgi:hypothetical protein
MHVYFSASAVVEALAWRAPDQLNSILAAFPFSASQM